MKMKATPSSIVERLRVSQHFYETMELHDRALLLKEAADAIAALRGELDSVLQQATITNAAYKQCFDERDALRAEVAALRKAGDYILIEAEMTPALPAWPEWDHVQRDLNVTVWNSNCAAEFKKRQIAFWSARCRLAVEALHRYEQTADHKCACITLEQIGTLPPKDAT